MKQCQQFVGLNNKIMSTFFVCLTFSSGIPILYPIAAFNFLLFYFMEKYMFIHLYKIPPHFTTKVGRRATTLIPIAILMHLAMSIWMLSNIKNHCKKGLIFPSLSHGFQMFQFPHYCALW